MDLGCLGKMGAYTCKKVERTAVGLQGNAAVHGKVHRLLCCGTARHVWAEAGQQCKTGGITVQKCVTGADGENRAPAGESVCAWAQLSTPELECNQAQGWQHHAVYTRYMQLIMSARQVF